VRLRRWILCCGDPWELSDLPGNGWIEGLVLVLMFVVLRVAALLVIRIRMEVGRKKTIWG